jgi:transposase
MPVIDEHGRLQDRQQVPTTLEGYRALRAWAARWPEPCWAVEGAHGIGRALAQWLVGDGEQVVDVPAKLAARVRVLLVGHGRKSDSDDAVSVAIAARSASALRPVGVEDQAAVLHLLTKRREDLVAARRNPPPARLPRCSARSTRPWPGHPTTSRSSWSSPSHDRRQRAGASRAAPRPSRPGSR